MRKLLTKTVAGCALAVLLGLTLSACTDSGSESAGANSAGGAERFRLPTIEVDEHARELLPANVRAAGTLVIASDPSYPPFEFYDADNTTMIGWDIDLGDALGAALGLRVEHRAATFDGILPGLAAEKYDVGMSAFGITPEREKVVTFVPNLRMGTGLAVKPGNPQKLGLDRPESLCGISLAAQKGSLQGSHLVPQLASGCKAAGQLEPELKLFPSQNDANLALASGRVDGVLADSVPMDYQGKVAGTFELAPGADYRPELIGLALPRGSGLEPAIREAFKGLLESGAYEKINAKWEMPGHTQIEQEEVNG